MASGTIKFMSSERGYGFIVPDDGGPDLFLHVSTVKRAGISTLGEGTKVIYEIEAGKPGKGPKATNLGVV